MGKSSSSAGKDSATYRLDRSRHLSKRMQAVEDGFRPLARAILESYESRANAGKRGDRPFDSAEGTLKRECYALIRRYRHKHQHEFLKRVSAYDNRRYDQPEYKENPFYWGLLAIDREVKSIGQGNLSEYAGQFLFADKHGVPPEYLIGFIYQSGGREMRIKIRTDSRDHEFELFRRMCEVQKRPN